MAFKLSTPSVLLCALCAGLPHLNRSDLSENDLEVRRIQFVDDAGKPVASLGALDGGGCRLSFFDEEGRTRMQIGTILTGYGIECLGDDGDEPLRIHYAENQFGPISRIRLGVGEGDGVSITSAPQIAAVEARQDGHVGTISASAYSGSVLASGPGGKLEVDSGGRSAAITYFRGAGETPLDFLRIIPQQEGLQIIRN